MKLGLFFLYKIETVCYVDNCFRDIFTREEGSEMPPKFYT